MSRQIDITKALSEEDASYLTVWEKHADINRAKAMGTWPEDFAVKSVEEETPEAEKDEDPDALPEQGEDESNGEYAHRLTVPQLRMLIEALGNEEEQNSAPPKSADKGKVKAHAVLILDRLDFEAAEAEDATE